jgi:hypothetical protein
MHRAWRPSQQDLLHCRDLAREAAGGEERTGPRKPLAPCRVTLPTSESACAAAAASNAAAAAAAGGRSGLGAPQCTISRALRSQPACPASDLRRPGRN